MAIKKMPVGPVVMLVGMDLRDISFMILLSNGEYDFAVKSLKTPRVSPLALVMEPRVGVGSRGHVHPVMVWQGRHCGKPPIRCNTNRFPHL